MALFRWKPGTTADQVEALEAGLGQLPARVPEIRRYWFGADVGLSSENGEFAVVADFDDVDGFRRYSENADHRAVIADLVAPIVATRTAVQFVVDG